MNFDYFSFHANAGDKGIFDIDDSGVGFDSKLYLFDGSGNLLASNDNFAADPGSASLYDAFLQYTFDTTGTYYLAVADAASTASGGVITGAAPNGSYLLSVSVGGNNSSFDTATTLGNLGTAGNVVDNVQIEPNVDVLLPPEPGSNDEPGHRDITLDSNPNGSSGQNSLTNSNQGYTNAGENNGRGVDPQVPNGIRTIYYNFQKLYGVDTNGNPLNNNNITNNEDQKQRVREAFELFSLYSGVQFVEAASVAEAEAMGAGYNDILTIATGDTRAVNAGTPTGASGVEGVAGTNNTVGLLAVMNAGENFSAADNQYGGKFFRIAMSEIAQLLGLNDSLDVDSVLGSGNGGGLGTENTANPLLVEPIFPGNADIVDLRRLYPRDSTDIDMYKFNLTESGTVSIETLAERLPEASQLDTVLTLYQEVQTANGPVRTEVARNDNYYGTDSFINLHLDAGTYYVGVSSVGNDNYNPLVLDSGAGGRTDGAYELRLDIQPDATSSIVDVDNSPQPDGSMRPATPIDGNGDGKPGGVFSYSFQVGDTIFVDKSGVKNTGQPLGSVANPYTNIDDALAEADARRKGTSPNSVAGDQIPVIVRILGNGGTDGQLGTVGDNTAYLLGKNNSGAALVDGATFKVPKGVTVVIDAGAELKLQAVNIDTGSSAVNVDRSGGAVQILGTTFNNVILTSFHDDSVGGDSDGVAPAAKPGDWGGVVYRADSDYDFEYDKTITNPGIPTGPSNTKIAFNDFVFSALPSDANQATITFTAVANLANSSEFLTVTLGAGGSTPITRQLFVTNGANPDGFGATDVPVPLVATLTLTREELHGLVGADGSIRISVNPSPGVDNLLFNESLTVNLKTATAEPMFLNIVNHATITYAGGPVESDTFDAIHLIDSRPTISFNTITQSAQAPVSADPNAFQDTFEDPTRYDHNLDRLGPNVHGNTIGNNSTNGLQIRIKLEDGVPLQTLSVPARLTATDMVYVITENLLIDGGAGGLVIDQGVNPDLTGDNSIGSRPSGRLRIDPGVIVKLSAARIEAELGSSNIIAEGTATDPIIFTSLNDDTYGAGGTFDTNNDSTQTLINLDFGAEGRAVWTAEGPGPITNGGSQTVQPSNEVTGAINAVVPDPNNANRIWVATVNGGIWRTDNALDPNGPTWTPLTDFQNSLSVTSLVLDPTDPSSNTLVAGIGHVSSFGPEGGPLEGLLRSTDGGMTWTRLDGDGVLNGRNIVSLVARGNTILAAATDFSFFGGTGAGVYRSTNGGASFELISGAGLSNLPTGAAFNIIADPTDLTGNTVYVSIQNKGLFRSNDAGATWTNVSVNDPYQLALFQES